MSTCVINAKGIDVHEIKHMDIKEFREKGYLQEINRRFLHPLGLALYTRIDDETGIETLGGLWDYRDDPEGLIFDIAVSAKDRVEDFRLKAEYVQAEAMKHADARASAFGYVIEPIPLDVEGEPSEK